MNKIKNEPLQVLASMLIINANYVHGTLYLKEDGVYFKAKGLLADQEIHSQFLFNDIQLIKFGFSFKPYRIVIKTFSDETYIFDFVSKQEGKALVQAVKQNLSHA
ncbi:hypothetical protein MTQ94_11430 [Staphylococcus agnetis]|uniref:hypothetical protein n=1 Tax=Staphylococcus agnetis TaxID=985762 RepID=UPI00208E5DE5|nr:hypothetical protein [Staphylococcus agnetis]MCO4339654.1 hypothetical protein [Staphylococcus agnetis]MCO4341454.1 hypothetical protein [Staphylococcus agnetis]MCO4344378.1 hypothetical protein [Staphylococcus agnetis]MCO4346709.1 hypothetical protein [Staphylococcus agnetis]MCO4348516.1 hypothetical protein [Staphylococcus agnetis]